MIILVEIGSFAPTIPKLRMSNAMKDMAKIFVAFIFDLLLWKAYNILC